MYVQNKIHYQIVLMNGKPKLSKIFAIFIVKAMIIGFLSLLLYVNW